MKDWYSLFAALTPEELDKLAVLRLMECTNGVIQYSFRDKLPDALSAEETRQAMKFSMSSIKNMEIPLSSETITFDGPTADIMRDVRKLYLAGAKRGDEEAYAEFLRASHACLRACGLDRLYKARIKLFNECYEMPAYTWDWGMNYIEGFMASKV